MTALAGLLEAARRVDAPFAHPQSARMVAASARYGWDLEPDEVHVAFDDGVLVGSGTIYTPGWDNHDLAWLGVTVHPDHRRLGHGTRMLRHLEGEAAKAGRSLLGGDAWEGSGGVAFLEKHGYVKKSQAVMRRQVLSDLAPAAVQQLHREALRHCEDYELVRLGGPLPEELLKDFCRMAAAINDAPLDDLELEDDVYHPRRVRDHEQAMTMRGQDFYRVVARHRGSPELAGHTTVMVERWVTGVAHQEDTTVTPEHRGHRLGLALKTDMMRWLAEEEPQLRTVDTWNTETNGYMIAINEALGYRFVAREVQFQKRA